MTAVKTWSIVSGLDESYSEASVACETRFKMSWSASDP